MNMNELFKAVTEIDLDPIKVKLMHVESGEGWSLAKANAVEKEYRRFLVLMKLYPEESTAPLEDVDTFWHYHILDTMKYADDCARVFGYFLHHYPYVGLRGEDDEQFRLDSGERMRTLYESTFGEAYPDSLDVPMQAAYCAGPIGKAANTAYCAGPIGKAAKTAYCAGPIGKAANTAYCAGPIGKAAKTAYCAGPIGKRAGRRVAKTAYCAGPIGMPRPNARSAVAIKTTFPA